MISYRKLKKYKDASEGRSEKVDIVRQDVVWRAESKAAFRYCIRQFVVSGKLLSTVGKAIHTQLTVEAFSIQPMLPLYLTVVSGSCNANPMITNAALFEEQLKAGFLRRIVCQKRFCPFCSVVCLHLSYRKRAAVN